MAETYTQGSSIEGMKVSGTSRNPLIHRGMVKHRGVRCYRYVAAFNVGSQIDDCIKGTPVFEPSAATELNASIKCDKAIIHSFDRKPKCGLEHASSTHKASGWYFHDQTGVAIELPHQDLIDGMRKRLEEWSARQLPPAR